jgi:peroxiredoxin Q/BCP
MKTPTKGDKAPDFTLTSPDGTMASLATVIQTGPVVLLFVPDITHRDAGEIVDNFRDDYNEFKALKASVITVINADSEAVSKFHEEHQLNYPIFPDPTAALFRKYGAVEGYLLKKPRKYGFVIDREGNVSKPFRSVDSNKFSRQALYALRDQMGRSALRDAGQKETGGGKLQR